ncbi:DUF4153 domain-containing protein [Clostridium aminobutyricum]|uniref:DUF4153 domain-containing protein n=1 Tax=Clostridium aminobutyricum TaxID=33953 RepID=A0A939D6N2_CLOAM|nr:DUF4153 domain-containing protein [Clostridium aminobutyricum]MBN7771818.1 DUF4153 domain-containing protein [Clostridium aminobutyricum]
MKKIINLANKLKGLNDAVVRYPLTSLFLLAIAAIITISIHSDKNYEEYMWSCIFGAVLCAVLQSAHERFFNKLSKRVALMGIGIILTLSYFLLINNAPEFSMEISIRTWVALMALFVAFMWVPVFRSRFSFNESFMVTFKAFFHSLLYAVVIFLGCSLILAAIDTLIVPINGNAYMDTANIVFVLFYPLFFLSLIPTYPGNRDYEVGLGSFEDRERQLNKAASCPRFLEVLISYIIIPIIEIFSVILVVYIVLNIRGDFWTDNLLEPMLISYAIAILFVYVLCSTLENKFSAWFRLIFPKVLVPIVLFQLVSSLIILRDSGVTHTRYFVILFGIFAILSGVFMSIAPVRKNGVLAAMLIVFSVVAITPPIDAFTISRISQENRLKGVLVQNKMLENNEIKPNGNISDEDKNKIVSSVEYLDALKYTGKISWFPKDFAIYEDFYDTFGFYKYDIPDKEYKNIYVAFNTEKPVAIEEYGYFTRTSVNSNDSGKMTVCTITQQDKTYTMIKEKGGESQKITILDEKNNEIIYFNTNEIFSRYKSYAIDQSRLSEEEATFLVENEKAKLKLLVQEANLSLSPNQPFYYADLYILVQLKE